MTYDSFKLVPPHGHGGGGLALFWKQNLNVEILSSDHNCIDTRVIFEEKTFYASFVYGDPDRPKRKEVWKKITDLAQSRDLPWFLTGDFNEILDNTEKQGGRARAESSFGDFRAFMSECDLYDLQYSGNFLSWRGVRYKYQVLCRLDRAMANSSWAETFPNARSEYLKFEGSDHRPLVSHFSYSNQRRKGLFRFDRNLKKK